MLCRVFAAPRDVVFKAWAADAIGKGFGPKGFTCRKKDGARRKAVIDFGAVELGYQTLDELAESLGR
jgi:hypothetical protein